jgi:hypothetical protein
LRNVRLQVAVVVEAGIVVVDGVGGGFETAVAGYYRRQVQNSVRNN